MNVFSRAWRHFVEDGFVMAMVWFFGLLVSYIIMRFVNAVLFVVAGAIFAASYSSRGGVSKVGMDALVFVGISQSLIMVALFTVIFVSAIRGAVIDEPGDEARRHGWRALPALFAVWLINVPALVWLYAGHGGGAALVLLAVGNVLWTLSAVDVAFEGSKFGINRVPEMFSGRAVEASLAMLCGVVVIGASAMFVGGIPIIGWLLMLPAIIWNLCLCIAIHEEAFGSMKEHRAEALEAARRRQAETAGGDRALPSYMIKVDEVATAGPSAFAPAAAAAVAAPAAASPAALEAGYAAGVIPAGGDWGTWVAVAAPSLALLTVAHDGAAPLSLQVGDEAGTWQPAQQLPASPSAVNVMLTPSWQYVRIVVDAASAPAAAPTTAADINVQLWWSPVQQSVPVPRAA